MQRDRERLDISSVPLLFTVSNGGSKIARVFHSGLFFCFFGSFYVRLITSVRVF